MCGRYVASSPTSVLASVFEVDESLIDEDHPSWNVAPTDPIPTVAVARDGSRRLGEMRWGLVPSWSTDPKGAARMINARLETVMRSRAFAPAFERRRCLLPADGFYEWERRPDGTKQAWFVHHPEGGPVGMAGVWEVWRPEGADPDTPLLRTAAVITTGADPMMEGVHDRMPVILPPDLWSDWLDRETAAETAWELAHTGLELVRRPVGPAVNNVRHNGPELIEPVAQPGPAPVPLKLL